MKQLLEYHQLNEFVVYTMEKMVEKERRRRGVSKEARREFISFLNYEKGRIFHTALGHVDYSVECVGFITCLLRGTQWAATGKVSIPIPTDFPTETKVSVRKFVEKGQ